MDFSLRITLVEPDGRAVADDQMTTTPFQRANLPGVDLRPANERAAAAKPAAVRLVPKTNRPLEAPRHAWLPSPSHPVPSRIRARSLLGVPPPPPPRAVPLSDEDEHRMQRRVRAWRRIAWAQRMLERFGFEAATP